MNAWKQLRAILLLPGMVAVVIPATILYLHRHGLAAVPVEHRHRLGVHRPWDSL